MAVTYEEAKAFIKDATRYKNNWEMVSNRSWDEIKKRRPDGKLWSLDMTKNRRMVRYPVWNSIFKIRQSLILSRLGIPICRDTTQDGSDTVGATAAILKERLAASLAKAQPLFDNLCASRDDFLATNFSIGRVYYERDEVKERVKELVVPEKRISPEGIEETIFFDSEGDEIATDDIMQDDEGYFIYRNQIVDVENETVCYEPILYRDVYVDPDARRWQRVKRLAFANYYSEPEFKEIFGADAFMDLSRGTPDMESGELAYPKRQTIKVYEYWDYYDRQCYWFAENGSKFITPRSYLMPEEDEGYGYKELNGLYNLHGFFPSPPPLIMNSPTDEFWPIPEYYQLMEVIYEIHAIFSRMMETTRAYRARLIFDDTIEGLKEALNELPEAGAIGVTNLSSSLVQSGGRLENAVQYIPTEGIIASLQQLYISLEQRLNMVYRLTGVSDMLQGLAADQTQRTFGERQMTEKYALNQLEEPQRKMAEYVRDVYELLTETAIKNFKDASLEMYIMPQTLQPGDRERYGAALGMLKDNFKRFRFELSTDETIALNEQYDKQMATELVNTLTSALEHTASIAESQPELVAIELHALKFLIQRYARGAKLFQTQITESIDNVVRKNEEQAANAQPPFDKDQAMYQLEVQRFQLEVQRDQAKSQVQMFDSQTNAQLAQMEMAQKERLAQLKAQLESMKMNAQAATENNKMQISYQELIAGINQSREELAIRQQELLLEYQKVSNAKEYEQYKLMLEDKFGTADAQLARTAQMIEAQYTQADMQERWATEQRLQAEHGINEALAQVEMLTKMKSAMNEQPAQVQQQQPGVVIEAPKPVPTTIKRTKKVELDRKGRPVKIEDSESQSGV